MRRFVVMLMLLVPSIAMAKQPSDRKVFPAEISADDALPVREIPRTIPSTVELRGPGQVWVRWSPWSSMLTNPLDDPQPSKH